MASSIWVLGSFRDYLRLYPTKRKQEIYIHEIKQLYFYELDSNKRLVIRHEPPKDELASIMYNSTVEHCVTKKEFNKYINNKHISKLNPTDITINYKKKLLHIYAHRWLFFLKPKLTLKIDRIWTNENPSMNRLVALPYYDRMANRILFIIPTRLDDHS